jgi:methyl-accepting chemotaxis protein
MRSIAHRLSGVRPKILLLAILPMLGAITFSVIGAGWTVRDLLHRAAGEDLERGIALAESDLGEIEVRMRGHATGLVQRPDLVAAITAADGAALRAILVPAIAALREADAAVSVVEATDAAGRILMRGHNPGRAGDDKSAVPDVAAALAGRPAVGREVSPTSGALALGAVLPVRDAGGRIVGTIKVGASLNDAVVRQLATSSNGAVALFGAGRMISSSIAGLSGEALPESVQVAQRNGTALPIANLVLPGAGEVLATLRPIHDLSGRPAGAMLVAQSRLPQQQAEQRVIVTILLIAGVVLLVAVPAAMVAARRLAHPLGAIAAAMARISGGDTRTEIPARQRTDEIGEMARALETFRQQTEANVALEAAAQAERVARDLRAVALERHTQDFGQSVAAVLDALRQSAEAMTVSATDMASAADRTRGDAARTADGAEASTRDLAAVAAATEELTTSVSEISRQVAHAAAAARAAVERAETTDMTVRGLSEAASRIDEVVRVIASVAGQTNLLALNATIEAARAGDAGKGFAVVASEVKQLAGQTAGATDRIARQVSAIQEATALAVDAVTSVAGSIARMDEIATAIAAAVEQQGAATREIAASVQAVAQQNMQASESMRGVSGIADSTQESSREVLATASGLAEVAANLRHEVTEFLRAMREDDGNRRRWDRVPGGGARVRLETAGAAAREVALIDISRGGCAVSANAALPLGTEVRVTLPGATSSVSGRVGRASSDGFAIVFRQDAATATAVDAAIARISGEERRAA